MRKIFAALLIMGMIATPALAKRVGNTEVVGTLDVTGGITIITSGTSLPGSCTVGEIFLDTDGDTNGSIYFCRAANTWKDIDDDGGASHDEVTLSGEDYLSLSTQVITAIEMNADNINWNDWIDVIQTEGVNWTSITDGAEITEAMIGDLAHTTSASDLSSGTIPVARVGAAHIDAITEIAAGLKTGLDIKVVTGTAGANNVFAAWNTDGDIVSSGLIKGTLTNGKYCRYNSTGTLLDCNYTCADITGSADLCDGSDDGGAPSADSIGTSEMDDGSDTPLTGEYLRVDTVDQAGFEYRTLAQVRSDLGLVIGTNVQAWDAQLDTWATVTPSANGQSLVASTNYASMRGLLDLEAGTDFYSISAADAAHEAELNNSAGLIAALSDETGSGLSVFNTSPTFETKIIGNFLTASEILITNASKEIISATVATYPSLPELAYVKGVTSVIQTQIDGKEAADTDITKKNETEVITGDWDFGGGGIEIENNTAVPGSCTVGQIFLDTDATAGQQLMACEGGTFVKQGDGGGSTINTADIADVSVTQDELEELQTIGATTISAAQWTILGGLAATLTNTELNYVDGVTSAIQTQIDGKEGTLTNSAGLRGALSDESGTGVALFVGGNIGAGTATTPSTNDNDTSVATTAYVQTELSAYDDDTLTFTNKRIKPRENTVASHATPTLNTDDYDTFSITALATNITNMSTNLSGTPDDFDELLYRIIDNGTARTIAWGTSYQDGGAVLPTTTTISKHLYVKFLYNATDSKWDCVAVTQEH